MELLRVADFTRLAASRRRGVSRRSLAALSSRTRRGKASHMSMAEKTKADAETAKVLTMNKARASRAILPSFPDLAGRAEPCIEMAELFPCEEIHCGAQQHLLSSRP